MTCGPAETWPKWGYRARLPIGQSDGMPMPDTVRRMQLRYAGTCGSCATSIPAGSGAFYDSASKFVYCLSCDTTDFTPGVAGASARRENERRRDARETRIRTDHPKLGGLILAVTKEPHSTSAWEIGAIGEEVLGERLNALVSSSVRVLHDRRMPRSRANVDHLVVCPSGVFVIDAKRYKDARPSLRVEGGFFRPRTETLTVGGRDKTALADGVQKQIDAVVDVLDVPGLDRIPVTGMLCFVDADWPLFGGSFMVDGLHVLWPAKAADLIRKPGELDDATIERAYLALARALPPA